jgi:hypothetical protein
MPVIRAIDSNGFNNFFLIYIYIQGKKTKNPASWTYGPARIGRCNEKPSHVGRPTSSGLRV